MVIDEAAQSALPRRQLVRPMSCRALRPSGVPSSSCTSSCVAAVSMRAASGRSASSMAVGCCQTARMSPARSSAVPGAAWRSTHRAARRAMDWGMVRVVASEVLMHRMVRPLRAL